MKLINLFALFFISTATVAEEIQFTAQPPVVDGLVDSKLWDEASWSQIEHIAVGERPEPQDFSGRFKVLWDTSSIYLLVELVDDVLIDTHADPLQNYWDDDALEIFIDEDKSGGLHLDNHNAYAYHIGLDNQVVDIDVDGNPALFNSHVESSWRRSITAPHKIVWEVALSVYDEQQQLVKLNSGKQLGFMLAYNDSDGFNGREAFIGSEEIEPVNGDKNRGYIDADVFGSLLLADKFSKRDKK